MLRKQKPTTYPVKPDRELLMWEKWITIRKEDTKKLSKQINRPPADLVMNLCENIRPDRERKVVLEEAKIEKKVTIRGNPWEQAPRLKQRCYCAPVYEIHRTAAEMGRPRKMVHLGVPTEVLVKELGCAGNRERKQCNNLDHEYHLYRDRKELELKENILKLDPFRPDISPLMVKGINPPPPVIIPLVPQLNETFESNVLQENMNLHEVYALRINNSIFLKSGVGQDLTYLKKLQKEPWHEKCTSWSYYLNVPASRAGIGKLHLQNLGTVTIRYCWKIIKKTVPFMPEDDYQVFFFNKNEDLIPPGQEKYINFLFVSDKPGIYKQPWELSLCNVDFFDTITDKLVVNLVADSIENAKATKRSIEELKAEICMKSVVNDINQLIETAISKAVTVQPKIYPYKKYFLEAEIFVMKNPVCFYHQTQVESLKELYREISNGKEWDLSIVSWRELMMTKQFDDRMKYYKLLQGSHSDLLKPWWEGSDLLKSKYHATRLLLGQLADQFDLVHDRLASLYNEDESSTISTYAGRPSPTSLASGPDPMETIRNVFYIHMHSLVGDTIETCAGVLNSLDLNRWIELDLCRT